MKRFLKLFLAVMVSTLGSCISANAQEVLLFESGPPNSQSGLRISDINLVVSADDFITTNNWSATSADFWSVEMPEMFAWDGTLKYFLFRDEDGKPSGSPIYQGDGQSIIKVPDDDVNTTYLGFKYTFDFEEEIELETQTVYWLAINLGGGGTMNTTQAFWAGTNNRVLSDAVISWNLSNWRQYYFNLAFRLYGSEVATTMIIPVDVMPGGCPNVIQTNKKGRIPVAILGTTEFDVTTLDLASIRLEGVPPMRSGLEDVATPYDQFVEKETANDCWAIGPDGFEDFTLKFDSQAIVSALGQEIQNRDVLVLKLTGNLREEFGGTAIEGVDVVLIRKPENK